MADVVVKVKCVQEVEIDVAAWALNYGADETVAEMRAQVKQAADEVVREHFRKVGVLREDAA